MNLLLLPEWVGELKYFLLSKLPGLNSVVPPGLESLFPLPQRWSAGLLSIVPAGL